MFCYSRKIKRPVKNYYFYSFSFSFFPFLNFTVLFTIMAKKGLCKDYSIVKIVIMIIVGKKNCDESTTKPSVNHSV